MSLLDIKNKLYSKNSNESLPKHDMSAFDIRTGGVKVDKNEQIIGDLWEPEKKLFGIEQKRALKLGGMIIGGIALLALITFGVLWYLQTAFSEERVTISISGDQEASSGELLTYEINYSNNNRTALKDVLLRVTYPESFNPAENANFKTEGQTSGVFTIGEIAKKGTGKVILSGSAYSTRGSLVYIKGDLIYKPAKVNSQFIARNQLAVNINSSPINLEIMAPQELAGGDALDYEVRYTNVGKENFDNIKIKLDYPEGFTFSKSSPIVSEGNDIWYIGQLPAGESGKIIVSGKLEGKGGEIKNIVAHIGTSENGKFVGYNEEKTSTAIIAIPITIGQAVNGKEISSVKAGENLRFVITYKNDSNAGLRDIIISDKIDSPAFDYASLDLRQGAFDQNSKTITWKGVDDPSLKLLGPGQTGQLFFSIKVKSNIAITSITDKNFVLSSIVKIDSPDIKSNLQSNKIVAGNRLDIKLESKIFLETKGFYNDSVITNSGPIPPQVGKPTTYTIHWKVFNASNDLSGAQVSAELPTGVAMTDKIVPNDGMLTYNSRNNSIVWEIGNLASGVGVLTPPKEVSFQVQITPSVNQIGGKVGLINAAVFSAKDLFTNTNISFKSEEKDTNLLEDSGIGSNFKVIQ